MHTYISAYIHTYVLACISGCGCVCARGDVRVTQAPLSACVPARAAGVWLNMHTHAWILGFGTWGMLVFVVCMSRCVCARAGVCT